MKKVNNIIITIMLMSVLVLLHSAAYLVTTTVYAATTEEVAREEITLDDLDKTLPNHLIDTVSATKEMAETKIKEQKVEKNKNSTKPTATVEEDKTNGGYSDYEIYIWAKLVMCEAGNQDQQCKENIAQVIENRVISDRFPNTIEGVVFDGCQFTPTFDGNWERFEPTKECYDAVYSVINMQTPINDATFFEACVGPSWHSENLQLLAQYGDVRFYKPY